MSHPLIQLMLAHANGHDVEPHAAHPPPHLVDVLFKFCCPCGYTWKYRSDAVWRDGAWRSPRRECLNCFGWRDAAVPAP